MRPDPAPSRAPALLSLVLLVVAATGGPAAASGEIRLTAGAVDPRAPVSPRLALAAYPPGVRGVFVIELDRPARPVDLAALERAGFSVLLGLPPRAWLAVGPAGAASGLEGAWVAPLQPAWKLAPGLSLEEESVEVVVQLVRSGPRGSVPARIAGRGEIRSRMDAGPFTNLRLVLSGPDLEALLLDPEVVAVHRFLAPELHDERQDQILAGQHDGTAPVGPGYAAWLAARGLSDPSPVLVDVTDDGIDFGDPAHPLNHPDLAGRIAYERDYTLDRLSASLDGVNCGGHGTLNAGVVAGVGAGTGMTDGAGFLHGQGVAAGARVGGSKIFTCAGFFDLSGASDGYATILGEAWGSGARISTNSWGSASFGLYDSDAQAYDFLVRDADGDPGDGLQPMAVVFSAGNSGPAAGSIGSPGTAKNVLTVGASENVRVSGTDGCGVTNLGADALADLASFSSRGPTDDGRLKPEVVAPGTHIVNTAAQNGSYDGTGVCDKYAPGGSPYYALSSGTSHSTPAVAGALALVFHELTAPGLLAGPEPSPALLKAAAVAMSAAMTGGADGQGGLLPAPPEPKQGFGRVDLARWFDEPGRFLADQGPRLVEAGEQRVFSGLVPSAGRQVRVVLAWTDAPAAVGSGALVNDLDLEVEADGTLYRGNVFSGGFSAAGGDPDRTNNLEAVFLPASPVAPFTVRVRAARVVGDGVPGNGDPIDQDFALVVLGATSEPRRGSLFFGRALHRCDQPLVLELSDADLAGSGSIDLLVASTGEPAGEPVTLVESPPASGLFTASLPLALGPAAADGVLQVETNDTARSSYADADTGGGAPAVVEAETAVDCGGPLVDLTDPDGGETLVPGGAFPILWSASDAGGVAGVDLDLSTAGPGGPWTAIARDQPAAGSFSWRPPAVNTATAFVRATARDAAGNAASDASAAAFTIRFPPPVATGVAPNAAATAGGTTVSIAGSGFRSGLRVRFGSRPETGGQDLVPLSVTAGLVRVATPPHLGGTFDVVVRNGDGQTATLAGAFTFSSFSDVPSTHSFFAHIEAVKWAGITGGCLAAPPSYCPDRTVTRGQMAVFLVKALGAAPDAGGPPVFADVDPLHPFYGHIQTFAALGITGGCGGGAFCPDAPVTRGQMAVFLIRALGELPDDSLPALFGDVPPGHPFYGWIQRLARLAITGGCGGGAYCPDAPVTRGQMAVFLTRAFALASALDEVPPPGRRSPSRR